MTGLTFGRVLAGALLGAAAGGLSAGMLGFPNPFEEPIYLLVPFGAILGVRLAVGKGGTARWTALLASWGLWAGMVWVLLRVLELGIDRPYLASSALALVGGWASLVWRSMRKLSGEPLDPTPLSLALVGLLSGRLMLSSGVWALRHALDAGLLPQSELAGLGAGITLLTLVVVCGVGGMASLAGRMDLNWALVVSSAGLAALGMAGGLWVLEQRLHLDAEWTFLPWILLEIGWFAYWGQRLAASESGKEGS